MSIGLRDVHLAADDRLDAGLRRRIVETDGAEEISMIGDGDGRHSVLRCRLGEHVVIAWRRRAD